MDQSIVYALARLGYSGALIAAPEKLAGGWLGPAAAAQSGTQIALRGLAARDAALSIGALVAVARRRSPRVWLALCALGDLADLAATLSAPPAELPPNARNGTIALAGSSALIGCALVLKRRGRPAASDSP